MSLLSEAGVNDHTVAVVADLFRGTWFRLESSDVLTGTRRGTRPGDPLEDLLFGFSFSGYLHIANLALAAKGLSTSVADALPPPPWANPKCR